MTASFAGGTLTVTGDDADNGVSVQSFVFSGTRIVTIGDLLGDDFWFDGVENPLLEPHEVKRLVVDLRGGDDFYSSSWGEHFASEIDATLLGGTGDDHITYQRNGTANISGGDGNDTLASYADKAATIFGGAGNDGISADSGGYFSGGDGDDRVGGGNGLALEPNATVLGGAGDDTLIGAGASVTVQGNSGNDDITATAVNLLVSGGDGADRILTIGGGPGSQVLGDAGDDDLSIFAAASTLVVGGEGNDTVTVSDGGDELESTDVTILGGTGNDTLTSESSGGLVSGGEGDDRLHAQSGVPLLGGLGDDVLTVSFEPGMADGGEGNDTLFTTHNSTLVGGEGNDTMQSSGGGDLTGGPGADFMIAEVIAPSLFDGGPDDDYLWSTVANTNLRGNSGNDVLLADHASTLDGASGDDVLVGSPEGDELNGGPGSDFLYGHLGDDLLSGDDGADFIAGDVLALYDRRSTDSDNEFLDLALWEIAELAPLLAGLEAGLFGWDGGVRSSGTGSDTIVGGDGADAILAGDGDDFIVPGPSSAGIRDVVFGDGLDIVSDYRLPFRSEFQTPTDPVEVADNLEQLNVGHHSVVMVGDR